MFAKIEITFEESSPDGKVVVTHKSGETVEATWENIQWTFEFGGLNKPGECAMIIKGIDPKRRDEAFRIIAKEHHGEETGDETSTEDPESSS